MENQKKRLINVIWIRYLNKIGGVESVIWNVVRKYNKKDIVVWYEYADTMQLARLYQYCDLIKFDPKQHIECDNLIINYGYEVIEGHFTANRVIYMVHANYKYLIEHNVDSTRPVTDKSFEYYAVSKWAAEKYYEVSGIMPKVCYNPILIDDERTALLIVSATRITSDKGSIADRMKMLADRLDERGVPFTWLVFTNSTKKIDNDNVINLPSRLGILPFMRKADFIAQLSTTEAFCMTALEAASLNKPLLITKIPSFYEMGLDDKKAIYFDFDMSNMDECIDRMISEKFKFNYTPKEDVWDSLLKEGKREVKVEAIKIYKVKATSASQDNSIEIAELGRIGKEGEIFELTEDRAKSLSGENSYGLKFIEVIEEVKQKTKKEKKL